MQGRAPPSSGKVAGIDYGRARVGLAVSDDLGSMAHPRGALDASNVRALLSRLCELAAAEPLSGFVVGLPLEMTGEEGPEARRVRAFAERLAKATSLPVVLFDERLTSIEATRRLDEGGAYGRRGRRKGREDATARGRVDGAAAAVLLQAWLDAGVERRGA